MKIERKVINEEKKIVQITTEDERWYSRLKGEQLIYIPSVTWICDYYPKGIAFYKWLSQRSWDESESLKQAAAEKGSKIHQACESLMDGITIKIDSKFINHETDLQEELSTEEYEAVMSFVAWFNLFKPEVVKKEFTVFDPQDRFAGTVDLVCKDKGELWLIDFKTGQNIWPSYELQVSAYKHALGGEMNLGILQLGYRRNKDKFKFTPVEDKFDLFLVAREIWANECSNIQPLQKDYPLELTLNKEVKNGISTKA